MYNCDWRPPAARYFARGKHHRRKDSSERTPDWLHAPKPRCRVEHYYLGFDYLLTHLAILIPPHIFHNPPVQGGNADLLAPEVEGYPQEKHSA